ncbi:MAG: hypothetical protein ACOX6V_05000 [Patescibacteria group bacterium]|jgi:hypothetical protein
MLLNNCKYTAGLVPFIKAHRILILLVCSYVVSRFILLDSDFHIYESEEIKYQAAATLVTTPDAYPGLNLNTFSLLSFIPTTLFNGPGSFVGVRILSIIGGLLVGGAMYVFWLQKNKKDIGLVSALIFWLMPISVFTQELVYRQCLLWGWIWLLLSSWRTVVNAGDVLRELLVVF